MRIQRLKQKGCGFQNCSSQGCSALFPTSSLLKMKGLLTLKRKKQTKTTKEEELPLARDQSWKFSSPSEHVLETYEAVSR